MRTLALCCLALGVLSCDAVDRVDADPPAPADVADGRPETASNENAATPNVGPIVDAPAGNWSVNTRHPRLHQLNDAAWSELVMEFLSGVVQTAPSEDGLRLIAMGRGSVAEQIGLSPGDTLRAFADARPPTRESLHRAWVTAERTGWATLLRTRDGKAETLHLWLGGSKRSRKTDVAAALVHIGIEPQAETRRLIDRAMLEALGAQTHLSNSDLLWHAFGLPHNADVVRVEDENVGDGGPERALELIAARAGERAFERLVADGSRELRLQYEVVPGLADASVLDAIRSAPARPPRRRLGGLFGADRPRSPDEGGGADDEEVVSIFESKGEHHVAVDAADFQALFEDPSTLARAARVVPSQRDGEIDGYKVYGIRRSSPLKHAGFKNGDKITKVQGKPIAGIDRAMEVYAELSRGDVESVTFTIERKGEEIELRIDIE